MTNAPIVAEKLVRHFGEVKAVDGIDLTVNQGEIFGFLGPNGAGKSTAVRMLTTLLKPTSGTARVAGFDVVKQADDVRRSIGVALQDAAIDPLMTGFELLELQAVLYGIPTAKMKKRADELLERVGLTAAATGACPRIRVVCAADSTSRSRSSINRSCSFSTNRPPVSIR